MHHIAADGDLRALQPAEVLPHRQHVQQRLRRMLVHAVACIDDARLHMFGQQRRRAAHRMADDDDVRAHLVKRHAGIDERFALGHARRAGGDIRRRGGHVFARQLEGHARARGIFIEQRHDGFSLQIVGSNNLAHHQRRIENRGDLLAAHAVKTQQIFALHAHSLLLSYRTTLMSPSNSGTRTPTSSFLLVGRFLPT